MPETKHTPGPWRVRNERYQCHVDVCVRDPLYVGDEKRWVSIMGPSIEHAAAVANATLAAAAPDLLESTWALHNILLQYTDYQASEWCAKAKAALAAAGCPGYESGPGTPP